MNSTVILRVMFSYGQGHLVTSKRSRRKEMVHSTKQLMSTLHTEYLVLKPQIGYNWTPKKGMNIQSTAW